MLWLVIALSLHKRAVVPPSTGIGEVKRVFIVVLENEDLEAALLQPYLASLAARGALLRNYFAIAHPSQPNYIALVAGSTLGVTGSEPQSLDAAHLGDLLDAHGTSWKLYAEGYPGDCFLGIDSGRYVRRHVPFLSFANVQRDRARCAAHVVPATQLDADLASRELPRVAFYIPDLDDDGHDTSVAFADAWLRARFEPRLADPNFSVGTLFIVMFDEGKTTGTNRVYVAFVGAGVQPGTVSFAAYDHYSLLRTIEEIFRLGTLHRLDDAATIIDDVWRR